MFRLVVNAAFLSDSVAESAFATSEVAETKAVICVLRSALLVLAATDTASVALASSVFKLAAVLGLEVVELPAAAPVTVATALNRLVALVWIAVRVAVALVPVGLRLVSEMFATNAVATLFVVCLLLTLLMLLDNATAMLEPRLVSEPVPLAAWVAESAAIPVIRLELAAIAGLE